MTTDSAARSDASLTRPPTSGVSLRGLLSALVLLAGLHAGAAQISSDPHFDVQIAFGLTLNTGVVFALSVLLTRRQLRVLLLIVALLSVVVCLPAYPVGYALVIALANVLATLVFRALALRYAAGGLRLDSFRSLLALFGCGVAAVAVNVLGSGTALSAMVVMGWVAVADLPPAVFLFGTRLLAQCEGIVTVTPLVLMLTRRRSIGWSWRAWAETGSWLGVMIVVSVAAVRIPGAACVLPLLFLVTFAGLLVAVLRRGILAAAVLTPAFAVAAAAMMASSELRNAGVGTATASVLRQESAGLIAAVLAWAVAGVVSERDAARQRAQSEEAAQEALTGLQRALLPTEMTSLHAVMTASRYRVAGSCNQIGGDWYDSAVLPGGGTALVIGDVEGHDLQAASVMGLVRGAVRSYALEGLPPSIVMERVNAFLTSAGSARLVTMAYVQLYPDDTIATVALAGHPAPLVVPLGGPSRVLDVRTGPILGFEGLTRWEEQTVRLPQDAALVLYTDGLVDFPTAAVDQQDRLVALAARTGGGSLDRLADALVSSAPSYDDAAVLAARVPSPTAPFPQRTFPAQAVSASIARLWLGDLFDLWRSSGVLPESRRVESQLGVAELLLTELMSNAVRHSDHWVTVRLDLTPPRLRVEVDDSSDRLPVLRQQEDVVAEGRGLRLVDALARRWGVQLVEHGKSVWFELPVESAQAPPRGAGCPSACGR